METYSTRLRQLKHKTSEVIKNYCLKYPHNILNQHHRDINTPVIIDHVSYNHIMFNNKTSEITIMSHSGDGWTIRITEELKILCEIADNIQGEL